MPSRARHPMSLFEDLTEMNAAENAALWETSATTSDAFLFGTIYQMTLHYSVSFLWLSYSYYYVSRGCLCVYRHAAVAHAVLSQ